MQAGAAGGKIEVAEVSDWGSEMQKQGGNVMGKLPADTPKGQPAIPNKVSTIAKKKCETERLHLYLQPIGFTTKQIDKCAETYFKPLQTRPGEPSLFCLQHRQ